MKTGQKLPTVSCSQASKGVLHSSTGSGGYYWVSKYSGYPTGGKIRHLACLLKKPIVGDPKSTNNMSAAQGMDDKLYLAQALRRGIRHDRSLRRHLSASPEPPRRHQRRPTPREAFPPRPRDTWNPQERRGATGPPTTVLAPIDVMDMTVHSQQGHKNDALT
jgi:hypothetical protein